MYHKIYNPYLSPFSIRCQDSVVVVKGQETIVVSDWVMEVVQDAHPGLHISEATVEEYQAYRKAKEDKETEEKKALEDAKKAAEKAAKEEVKIQAEKKKLAEKKQQEEEAAKQKEAEEIAAKQVALEQQVRETAVERYPKVEAKVKRKYKSKKL